MPNTVRMDPADGSNWAVVYVEPDGFRLSVQNAGTSLALRLTPDEARQLAAILETAADTVEKM